jgi:[ribosomal protein S5]-alanine N-acetyltransferase
MTAPLRTEHLELIPATREILTADLDDREELSRLLTARVPGTWPPLLMDENVIREFIRMCSDTPGPIFSTWYWIHIEPGTGSRILVGNGGIIQSEENPDTAVLGYSVLDEYQNRGYATEAVRCLIPVFFSLPGIRKIIATTNPDLGASIRVLEKNGFVREGLIRSGSGAEEGTICYVLENI